jgi:hypothetical protein
LFVVLELMQLLLVLLPTGNLLFSTCARYTEVAYARSVIIILRLEIADTGGLCARDVPQKVCLVQQYTVTASQQSRHYDISFYNPLS